MNIMQHKGYTARVEFDERDNIFVGRVLGVNSIISFHGESVNIARAESKRKAQITIKDIPIDRLGESQRPVENE